jgi:DNA-binding transcriptional MerR regulator
MTLGEFSHRSQLSLKALRLYERLGLLRPVAVDQRNGYRRYHESSVRYMSVTTAAQRRLLTDDDTR